MTYPKRLSQERERSLEQRLKAGDERALGELFDVAAPWILGLAFRILQDEDEAEEVVGDVFVQLWRHIDQHDGGRGPLVPWILSIARNRSLDVLRRRRRWWRKSAHLEQAQAAEASDPAVAAPHEAGTNAAGVELFEGELEGLLRAVEPHDRRVVADAGECGRKDCG